MANNHTAGAAARTFAPSELCQRMLAKTSKGTCGPCILYLGWDHFLWTCMRR